ncbi:MAG: ligase-associated DNA damage response endonuclease PdeM [Flavobacteriales bacterium]
MKAKIKNNEFVLGGEKEMYWPDKKTLIISDLHLGKTKHFTQNGIPMPKLVNQNNYWRLTEVLDKYEVKRVVFLGDLFHSVYNNEWETFKDFMANYPALKWILVLGNHDILHPEHYKEAALEVVLSLKEEGLNFTHEPEPSSEEYYNICGHIHPAVRLQGGGTQYLRVPCFYFGEEGGVIPAFGEFTGMHVIKPRLGDQVFAVAEKEVILVS